MLGFQGLGFRVEGFGLGLSGSGLSSCAVAGRRHVTPGFVGGGVWEFPKIRGTLFRCPYNKDPTI